MRHHPARLIERKRDGLSWSAAEIQDLVAGVVDGSLADAQLGALLMAVCWRGLDAGETAALTLAMRDSGRVLEWPGRAARGAKPVVDKHSTGGVGDKVSLVLAPLLAACGVVVPMISGRGLGHTGGTLDKLAAIPGYRTELEPGEFAAVVEQCGFAMAGAGPDLAPADRRMYAVRDVTGTVPQRSLITASILSKKLAEGLDGLVMDIKVGRGAFLTDPAEARALADGIVATGALAGLPVRAVLTQMDVPLGWAVGNALEVREALECLRGRGPGDLREVTLTLGAALLDLVDAAPSEAEGRDRLTAALEDGRALECLHANVRAQGGDLHALDSLPAAPVVAPLVATRSGVLEDIDPRQVGDVVVDLGGGRRRATDAVDPRVGVVFSHRVGSEVAAGEPLAMIYAATSAAAEAAAAGLTAAVAIGDEPVEPVPAILRPAGR